MTESAPDTYRTRLIAARQGLGLTPRQMARYLLTPRQTYMQWESGARRTPGVAVIAAEMLQPHSIQRIEIAERWRKGETISTLTHEFGLSERKLRKILSSEGLARGRQSRYPVAEIVKRLRSGDETLAALAREYGASTNRIWQIAQSHGIKRNVRSPRVQEIIARLRAGEQQKDLAHEYGLTRQRISQIAKIAATESAD